MEAKEKLGTSPRGRERTDPRSLGGQSHSKPCWDGREGQQGEEKGGFAPLSAGLVLPCLMKIRNLGRADFLPDLTPPICQRTELLQSSRSGEGGTG